MSLPDEFPDWDFDFSHWDIHDWFTVDEAAYLASEQDPAGNRKKLDSYNKIYNSVRTALIRSIEKGQLEAEIETYNDYDRNWIDEHKTLISRGNLKQWFSTRRMQPDFLFATSNQDTQNVGALQAQIKELQIELEKVKASAEKPYLDGSHPYFSPDLEAAVSAWMAIYGNGEPGRKRGNIKILTEWLENNRPEVERGNGGTIANIARVANPNKAGGAPVTE